VRGHLVGDHTIGIYPLLQDETCWFLAVDFDKKAWQRDATAFLAVCCELNVPAALERSRSGNGGQRVDLLRPSDPRNHRTKTRLCNPDSCNGVPSPTWTGFVRPFFPPNQDTMPKEGLGTCSS
jgi:hypothetical protein